MGMSLGLLALRLTAEGVTKVKRSTQDNVTLSRILHNPAYVMADEQVRLYLMGRGAHITSSSERFDGVHSVLLVGKRKVSDRKYTGLKDHTASPDVSAEHATPDTGQQSLDAFGVISIGDQPVVSASDGDTGLVGNQENQEKEPLSGG